MHATSSLVNFTLSTPIFLFLGVGELGAEAEASSAGSCLVLHLTFLQSISAREKTKHNYKGREIESYQTLPM